jgi:undecaprenyl diphosphate synthase
VDALMHLLMKHLEGDIFMKNGVRFRIIGDRKRLPLFVREGVEALEDLTKDNKGTCLILALSYSSKWELTDTVRQLATKVKNGELNPEDINEGRISDNLQTSFMPDPELLIRTGGEQRISNYLLWQCAYSEFYFTDVYWPDFNREELYKALCAYQHRQRRFGKTGEQIEQKT